MGRNLVETLMGGVVLVVAAAFLFFAYQTAGMRNVEGYEVKANFDRVDGLLEGSDVRMSGIKIGTVTHQTLDPKTYLAVVTMSIDRKVKLPLDSSAQVASDGLLGDKYLTLIAGAEEDMIKPGGRIEHTQGSVDIVSLVGRLIFSQTEKDKVPKAKESAR